MHFLPRDVETDDLCCSPQTPGSQLERGCVSVYFWVSPCPLFKTQILCVQAAAGVFVVDGADFLIFLPSHVLQLLRNFLLWQKIRSGGAPKRELAKTRWGGGEDFKRGPWAFWLSRLPLPGLPGCYRADRKLITPRVYMALLQKSFLMHYLM